MKIYNTTTKAFIEMLINDPKSGCDWANDLIGNSAHDFDTIIINDEEFLSGDQEMCDWWVDYCSEYEDADQNIFDLLRENDIDTSDIKEDYHNYICGIEFNELPSAMKKFFDDNK